MKSQYLICKLSSKDKLEVIRKVDAEELKQIELNLTWANKLKSEMPVFDGPAGCVYYKTQEELNKPFFAKTNKYFWNYISLYTDTIVIPYTKILQ